MSGPSCDLVQPDATGHSKGLTVSPCTPSHASLFLLLLVVAEVALLLLLLLLLLLGLP